MPKIAYEHRRYVAWKIDLIAKAIIIVKQYQAAGYELTLRQVYYQFVARDWMPQRWADKKTGSTNNQKAYKYLGNLLAQARLSGLMDWNSMIDKTRSMGGLPHWKTSQDILKSVAQQYAVDKWTDQKYRPEVWIEKDAIESVASVICDRHDVPYFSCRGYTSLTSIWSAAQRLANVAVTSIPVILHLGDHDPSGIDMSRDIEERVRLFGGKKLRSKLIFERVALNMNQVEQYNPPENPAKISDSRFNKYMKQFGESSWELDALDPEVVDGLVSARLDNYKNKRLFNKFKKQETTDKSELQALSDKWPTISKGLS